MLLICFTVNVSIAEGKQLATSRDAKFIETSSGIQHNVDELLVGILKQVSRKNQSDGRRGFSWGMQIELNRHAVGMVYFSLSALVGHFGQYQFV